MSGRRIVVSGLSVLVLSIVGVGLSGGIANASPSRDCVKMGGVAVTDDDTPEITQCYMNTGIWLHGPGMYDFEWAIG